jgi:hypothetical protein
MRGMADIQAAAGLAASGAIVTPASFSTRWNSGDVSMILAAAARSRSTASSGSTKVAGYWFRQASSAGSCNAGNDTSTA